MPHLDEASLLVAFKAGDRAAGDGLLRLHEQPTILPLVKSFCRRWRQYGPDLDDLMQEGRLLFLRAATHHKAELGPLEAYARSVISNSLIDSLVRVSSSIRGRGSFRRAGRVVGVEELPEWAKAPLSLDAPNLDGRSRISSRPSEDPSPEEQLAEAEMRKLLDEQVAMLDQRQATVIRRRYLDEDQATQEELGVQFGMSSANVGLIERAAIDTMRKRCVGRPP